MNKQFGLRSALVVSLLATSSLTVPVIAQDMALEEIVVTATKRTENLQSVAMSLTAFSGDYLEKSNIQDFNDMETRVPSLQFDSFSPGIPRYFIRGIGNTTRSSSVDSAVGIFVDEVYMGRPEMTNNDFSDIERVEVLRGPQGTLFGRNVVGGAISFFSRKPDDQVIAEASATIGNYNKRDARVYASGPVAENVFAKIAVATRNHDGYAFNTTTNNDIEDEQYIGIRGALRFVPNENLDIQINADTSRRRGTGAWWDLYIEGPNSLGKSNADPRRGRNHAEDGYADTDNNGVSLNVNWDTGAGTVTSITAYREAESLDRANTTGLYVAPLTDPNRFQTHLALFIQEDDNWSRQYSQELRYASDSEGPLNYVVGAFAYHDNVHHIRYTDFRFVAFNIQGRAIYDAGNQTDSIAFFGNGTYDITEDFNIQAGLRWSQDKKDHIVTTSGTNSTPWRNRGVIVPGFTAPGEEKWDAFTPSVSFNYQVTDDHFVYASASRGFKSGGYNDTDTEAASAERAFAPEYAWNYEVGAKTQWLDNRVRFNASAFYIDYTDLQVSVIVTLDPLLPPFTLTGNAGAAEVKGLETEWTFVPVDNLNIYGNYTYTDSKLKNLTLGTVVADGNKLARAPKHKMLIGASYAMPVTDTITATARADYSHQSLFYSTINNSPVEIVPSAETVDAGLTFSGIADHWELEFWGKNLTDELNLNTISLVPLLEGYASFTPPRTYGMTVRFKY